MITKYDSDSQNLITVTKYYSLGADQAYRKQSEICFNNCSWQAINKETGKQQQLIEYNTPQKVYPLDEYLDCLPNNFGYRWDEGLEIFPEYFYGNCWDTMENPYQIMSLNYQENTISMNCTGKYVSGPIDQRKILLYHEAKDLWQISDSNNTKISKHHEFAIGGCGDNFNKAVYIPRFNEELYKQRLKKKNQGKSLMIFFIVVDSFSRNHFFRKLPKVVKTLNKLQNSTFSVFDFLIHNIQGTASQQNQIPIFGANVKGKVKQQINITNPGFDTLWDIYNQNGFVTLLGLENCDYSLPRKLGSNLTADYVINPFYCAAKHFLDYRASKSNKNQRCIGPYMSHWYAMNYTLHFNKIYQELNQWIYLHFDAAHEKTGQHAQTLDNDLDWFISKLIEQNKNNQIVFFIEGDHGMRYGNWFNDNRAYQENRLPPLFVIAQDELLQKVDGSYDCLYHNQFRLNTKLDIRKSMIWLAGLPHNLDYQSVELYPAINIFKEKANNNRNCQNSGIPAWHCSCLELQEIHIDKNDQELMGLNYLINTLAHGSIDYINSITFTNFVMPPGSLCQKITLQSVIKAFGIQLDSQAEQIKLHLCIEEDSQAIFEITFLVSSAKRNMKPKQDWYPLNPVIYRSFPKKWRVNSPQIISIQRLDSFQGICEKKAEESLIPPELCICK